MDLSVVILTYNEERHIVRALESVAGIAREVFVIDSFSTDHTVELGQARGATVIQHAFVNQAKQFQWVLDTVPIKTDWIMRLDADEIIEPDLAAEIQDKLSSLGEDVVGVNLKRKHIFMGRWIRHGGRYPLTLMRIWRRGHARIEDRWMDEHMIVWGGRTMTFNGGFADCNLNDLTYFTNKHNNYATREAIGTLNRKYGLFACSEELQHETIPLQAALKRWVKERCYNHLPFWVGPLMYFLYRYFFQLGFIDGRAGLIYHFLQGFWYRFLVGAKVVEYDKVLASCSRREERLAALEQMTGYKLGA
jgi:glycosyltransferase involved in cell wall biosynthesis